MKDDKYTATNFGGEAFWIQKAVLEWVNYNMCVYGYFPGYSEGYLDNGINCIMPDDQIDEFKATLSEIDKKFFYFIQL